MLLSAFSLFPVSAPADSTGEQSPTSTAAVGAGFANSTNAFTCDGSVAQANANNRTQDYYVYGFTLPADSTIDGIEVRVRANDGKKKDRQFKVRLSWDGGTSFTGWQNTPKFAKNAPLTDFFLGGPAFLWGRAWTPSELSDVNFRVRVSAKKADAGNPANLDCIPVTVYFTVPTSTPTSTPTATTTATTTSTETVTATATATASYTATFTATPTATATQTVTITATGTNTPTATLTATATDTQTPTATASGTNTATHTSTLTPLPTETQTATQIPAALCGATPIPSGCRMPGKSLLLIKDKSDDTKDKLIWKWLRGDAPLAELGDPLTVTGYSLCIYDEIGMVASFSMGLEVQPGGVCGGKDCWKQLGSATPKGFSFKDTGLVQDGVQRILVKGGRPGRDKVLVKGKRTNLPLPSHASEETFFNQDTGVIVQLVNSVGGCWEAVYEPGDVKRNRSYQYKAKSTVP